MVTCHFNKVQWPFNSIKIVLFNQNRSRKLLISVRLWPHSFSTKEIIDYTVVWTKISFLSQNHLHSETKSLFWSRLLHSHNVTPGMRVVGQILDKGFAEVFFYRTLSTVWYKPRKIWAKTELAADKD